MDSWHWRWRLGLIGAESLRVRLPTLICCFRWTVYRAEVVCALSSVMTTACPAATASPAPPFLRSLLCPPRPTSRSKPPTSSEQGSTSFCRREPVPARQAPVLVEGEVATAGGDLQPFVDLVDSHGPDAILAAPTTRRARRNSQSVAGRGQGDLDRVVRCHGCVAFLLRPTGACRRVSVGRALRTRGRQCGAVQARPGARRLARCGCGGSPSSGPITTSARRVVCRILRPRQCCDMHGFVEEGGAVMLAPNSFACARSPGPLPR